MRKGQKQRVGLLTRYNRGEFDEDTYLLPVVAIPPTPHSHEITFGNPTQQESMNLPLILLIGGIWFCWFLVMLYLFTG